MDGKKIKDIRKSLGLTQQQLSKKVGISYQTISELENGKVIPESKRPLYESAFAQIMSIENGIDIVNEGSPGYGSKDLLDDILYQLKEIRKENKQLQEKLDKEIKLNQISRSQFSIALDILSSFNDEFLNKKSPITEENISKLK